MKTKLTLFFIILIFFLSYPQNLLSQSLTINKSADKNPQRISMYGEGYYWEDFKGPDFPPPAWGVVNLKGSNQWQRMWEDGVRIVGAAILNEFGGDTVSLDWIYVRDTVEAGDSLSFEASPRGMYYPDTLMVRVSAQDNFAQDSLSLEAAFTDTLIVIPMDSFTEYGWYKYRFSLDKYAGQKIFIGFRDYSIRGYGWIINNIILGKRHRAEIKALSMKVKSIAFTGESVGISAKYFNEGYETQNFTVTCEIPGTGYSKQINFENIASGATVDAQFEPWIPADSGNYTVRVYSQLAGDENVINDTLSSSIKIYKTTPGISWRSEPAMPDYLYAQATASYVKRGDGVTPDTTYLFVIGGGNVSYYQTGIHKYNSVTGEWAQVNNLPQPLGNLQAAQLSGKIYIAGGQNTQYSAKLYIYDIEKNNVAQGPDMPAPLINYSIGTYGDSLIYIMGGYSGGGISNSVMIYNVKAGNWNWGTSIPGAGRGSRGGAICGNKIILAGGGWVENNAFQLTDEVLIGVIDTLNPSDISWSAGPPYPSGPISDPFSGAWYGKDKKYICFAGGLGPNDTYLPDTWIYDLNKNEWEAVAPKISGAQGASNMAAVIKDDSVYLAALGGNISFHYDNILNVNEWLKIGFDDSPFIYGKNITAHSLDIKDSVLLAGIGETPSAQFLNSKRVPATFDVTMEITPGGYKSVRTITDLGFKETAKIDFDEWVPATGGTYSIKVYSSLEGDENKFNDTLTTTRYVYNGDIAINGVTFGTPLYVKKAAHPKTGFINQGGLTNSFNVTMIIEPGNYRSVKEVANLEAGDTAMVEFDSWMPDANGVYTIKTFSSLDNDGVSSNDTLVIYKTVLDSLTGSAWHAEADLLEGRMMHGSASYLKHTDGFPDTAYTFVIGGLNRYESIMWNIFKYNSVNGAWSETCPFLGYPVYGAQTVQIGGKIYIPGGFANPSMPLNNLTIYDIEKDTLINGPYMPISCAAYALGTYGDSLIYVIGGRNPLDWAEPSLKTVQIYNINTGVWDYGTPLDDNAKGAVAGSICGNKIVLSYGSSGAIRIGSIDIIDPYKITWSDGGTYPEGSYNGKAAAPWYGKDIKRVYFSGGNDTQDHIFITKATWAYDIESETWVKYPDKPTAAYTASMSAITRNDSVYMAVTGGVNDTSFSKVSANEWLYIGRNEKVTANAAVIAMETPDSVVDGEKVAVKASFINRMPGDISFTVKMEVAPGDFISVDTVKSLAFKDIKEATFADWTPKTVGTYTVKISISSSNDEDKSDNVITRQIIVNKSIGTKDEPITPAVYSLAQNYPNPFNPETVIKYSLAQAGQVELRVYNMLGQEVAALVNGFENAGEHQVKFNAVSLNLSSGVYIYRIKSGSFVQTKKLMLIK